MAHKFKTALIGATALAFLAPLTSIVQAAPPADQTPYTHALGDLRVAKTALRHESGDPAVTAQETAAIKEINKAIGELTRVASGHGAKGDDAMNVGEGATGEGPGRDIDVSPAAGAKPDAKLDHGSRLHNAEEALRKARADIDAGSADTATKTERARISAHIDSALQSVQQAGAH